MDLPKVAGGMKHGNERHCGLTCILVTSGDFWPEVQYFKICLLKLDVDSHICDGKQCPRDG